MILIHPYLADLPIFDAEVESIAESIAEVGLLHPITLDVDGNLIGGRHRIAACEKAGVEPTFETHEGDPLAFMLHDNATRKHQSTGQRAAENALSLSSAGQRGDGKWKYGRVANDEGLHRSDMKKALAQCGLILDHLGRDVLVGVALGNLTINDAYERANAARQAEDDKLAAQAREKQAEADAQAEIEAKDPDLASRVGKGDIQTYREALAIWKQRNAEAAAEERRLKAEHAAAVDRLANYIKSFLRGVDTAAHLHEDAMRDEVLAALPQHDRDRFLRIEKDTTWPASLS